MADAAEELDVVALEAHAGAAAEAEAAAGELVADLLDGDGQARGQPLDHHREGGAVGLTGGQVTQHADDLTRRARAGKGTVQDTGAPPAPSLIRRSCSRTGVVGLDPSVTPVREAASGAAVPVEDRGRRRGWR